MYGQLAELGIKGHAVARFYNGETWTNVIHPKEPAPEKPKPRKNPLAFLRRRPALSAPEKDTRPVAPVVDGDGRILVSIPSFRDGEQCGQTVYDVFRRAEKPGNVVISLIEQQNEEDTYCLEEYCKLAGNVDIFQRYEFQKGRSSVIADELLKKRCPRVDQIRVVRVHDNGAKGGPWARALGRRSIGNEEYCMQISSHTTLVSHWDNKAKREWLDVQNEFAVLSNPPKALGVKGSANAVPRTCGLEFLDEEQLPSYDSHPDGKVESLGTPLLAHTWSPGFSFSKCHLEEAAPGDGFLPYVASNVEAFARYARMWTRGYDVYTPTQNIVYRKVDPNPHKLEWINSWYGRKSLFLKKSLRRIRSYLEITGVGDDAATLEKVDNLGVYGLGRRRSLQELASFVGLDLGAKESRPSDAPCGNFEWVPYDSSISPLEHRYSDPDDLDPQPEFPLRTNLTFGATGSAMAAGAVLEGDLEDGTSSASARNVLVASPLDPKRVPYGTLFVLWMIGLFLWCQIHGVLSPAHKARTRRKKNKSK